MLVIPTHCVHQRSSDVPWKLIQIHLIGLKMITYLLQIILLIHIWLFKHDRYKHKKGTELMKIFVSLCEFLSSIPAIISVLWSIEAAQVLHMRK